MRQVPSFKSAQKKVGEVSLSNPGDISDEDILSGHKSLNNMSGWMTERK